MTNHTNPQLDLAFDYVRLTHKNIFLTGKAGTGKTTFLHQVKRETAKRMVIVAPTGVAAINAGGMTIHSFFQLPFGPFLPGATQDPSRIRKFSREKIRLIQSLDLLVIDEISMVRADLLDGIDDVLRRYRHSAQPFGGVQLLMIGDLHQLPPVVKDEEWNLLREHYKTPYFFGSRALENSQPVTIELKHIYRQSDTTFIDLLNKVRDNKTDPAVLDVLNSRYIPDFQPTAAEPYITLTAHNATAQSINTGQLQSISAPAQTFKAKIEGDFPTFSYPTDEVFECKTGAQVMFVKNDAAREKRFYNGKIGKITHISDGVIYVKCPDDNFEIDVQPAEWANVKYTLNESTKEVSEEILGTFTQYPLKLAWAITIHKSQGLTFERAIIDAQAAFAHGQVYVALSRCKSFEGIVLRSKIGGSSVKTDYVVKNYSEEADKNAPTDQHLHQSKIEFQGKLLLELFDFKQLRGHLRRLLRVCMEHERSLHPDAREQSRQLEQLALEQGFTIAERFNPQIEHYCRMPELPEDNTALRERLEKAGVYFTNLLGNILIPAAKQIQFISDNQSVIKAAEEALTAIQQELYIKNACFGDLQTGFSATRYLRKKADAELDFQFASQSAKVSQRQKESAPKNTPHPELYIRLKKWREDVAEDGNLVLYEVLPTRALLEIAHLLPLDLHALRKIKGIGAIKAKQFGAHLIAIIQEYCQEKRIEGNLLTTLNAEALAVKAPKLDTKVATFDLFKAGKSIDEIAAERGFVRSTIEGHLAYFIGLGELDILDVLTPDAFSNIEQFFRNNNTASSADAKTYFEDQYSYGEIKMVLQHLGAASDSTV